MNPALSSPGIGPCVKDCISIYFWDKTTEYFGRCWIKYHMLSEGSVFARFKKSRDLSSVSQSASPIRQSVSVPVNRETSSGVVVPPSGKTHKTAGLLDGVISVVLVALFFGLPLFFTSVTFQGIAFEKQLYFYFWLLIGIVAWSSKGVITGELRIRRTSLDIPLLLFWLFYVVTAIFSVDRWHSFWGFFGDPSRGVISVTALILVYYLILSHFTVKRFYWMFWSFLLSGYLVAVWSFMVMLKLRFLPVAWEKYAPISLIGTVSNLGIFLGVLIPLFITAIFVLWRNDAINKLFRKILTILIFIGLGLVLFLLLALYPFIFAGISKIIVLGGLSLFLIYILAQIVRPEERFVWLPMVVFVIVLAFLMIGNYNLGLVRANLPVEVSPNMTLSWQIAKDAVKENFFSGVGAANYGYAFSMFHSQEYNLNALYSLRFYQGTGLFFEALPTIGVVGTILLLILWLSFISIGLYFLTYEKQRNKIYSLGLWSVVVMLFLASFVSAVGGGLLIIGILLATLALGTVLWESGAEEQYLKLSLKATPKFALALAFIFMVVSTGVAFLFVFMGKVFIADTIAGKAVRIGATSPSKDSVDLFARAINIYPQEGRYYMRLAQGYMALANQEAGKPEQERSLDTVATYIREAVKVGKETKRLMPNDVAGIEALGLIYENAGLYANDALPEAEGLYTRALELEPQNALYQVKLGQIKKLTADGKPEGAERDGLYREAKDLFQKAIDKKNNLAVAYYNLAVVQSYLKEIDGAVENAGKALSFDRSNLNYAYNLGVLYQLRNKEGDKNLAEKMFRDVLTVNEKLIDVRLSLGLLYESMNKDDAAVEEYNKILGYLPEDGTDNTKQTRDQVKKLIDNVERGISNLTKKTATVAPVEILPAGPVTPSLESPVSPVVEPVSGSGQ